VMCDMLFFYIDFSLGGWCSDELDFFCLLLFVFFGIVFEFQNIFSQLLVTWCNEKRDLCLPFWMENEGRPLRKGLWLTNSSLEFKVWGNR
jgi:hypothetical protein